MIGTYDQSCWQPKALELLLCLLVLLWDELQVRKKKKSFTCFGQPIRPITCANHGNNVICS